MTEDLQHPLKLGLGGGEKLHETGEGPGFDAFHFHVSLKIEFWEGQEGFVLRSGGQSTGGVKLPAWWEAPPKIGDAPRTAPAKPALSGEKYVLAGGAGQNMIPFFFPRLRAGKLCEACPPGRVRWGGKVGGDLWVLRAAARTCWVCPTGRVRWAEGGWIPYREAPTPKAFPSGKVPQCALGRMRGDRLTQRDRRRRPERRQVPPSTRKGWVQNRPLIRHLR